MSDINDMDKQIALTAQSLVDHTKSCDERYATIAAAMLDLKDRIKDILKWLIGVAAAVFLIMISMLGFLAVNYIRVITTQSTQQHVNHDSLLDSLDNLI